MSEPAAELHAAIRGNDAARVRAVLRDHPELKSTIDNALPRGAFGLILEHRPPLDALTDEFPGKPLDWALYGSRHGWHCRSGDYGGTVEALLDAGADPPADAPDASEPVRDLLRRYNRRG